MTILPNCNKKKPQQNSSSSEHETADGNSNVNLHSNQHQLPNLSNIPSHLAQNGESVSCNNYYSLSSQSPPPCWSPNAASVSREEKRTVHSSPVHYEETHDSGSSISKRNRYRASPLRSVRPKLHRGNVSPPYPGTSNPWSVSSVNAHSLAIPQPIVGSRSPLPPQAGPSETENGTISDEDHTAYNSGDEYETFGRWNLTKEQWEEKERWFEKKMKKHRRIIRKMHEDGACLFRAISDQVYGDQEMHDVVRQQCMNYIEQNEGAYAPFVSESFETYIGRKRKNDCHGNHIEIAAMSEMYNRVIEVYCYSSKPINIFQSSMQTDNAPIRLTYHKGTHYNGLIDPYNATVGVGLGLPGLQPGLADKNLVNEATRQSENVHIEQTMLEDKIRATDYEATGEAIEEQIAQQSYLEWIQEQQKRQNSGDAASKSPKERHSPHHKIIDDNSMGARASPRLNNLASSSKNSPKLHRKSPRNSPKTSPPTQKGTGADCSNVKDLAVAGSSKDPMPSSSKLKYGDFEVNENASYLDLLSPDMFGLTSSEEAAILARVLAESQREYLESLKNKRNEEDKSDAPKACSSSH